MNKEQIIIKGIWKQTPMEIFKEIMEWNGSMKCRNGRWMGQLLHDDVRYPLLRTIPIKKHITYGQKEGTDKKYHDTIVHFSNPKYAIILSDIDSYSASGICQYGYSFKVGFQMQRYLIS